MIQSETFFCPSRLIKGHNKGANYTHILSLKKTQVQVARKYIEEYIELPQDRKWIKKFGDWYEAISLYLIALIF